MNIWFIEIGEPLPVERGKRLLRYAHFSAWLSVHGHNVTWWACDFSHAVKTHVIAPGKHRLENGVRLMILHGPGYAANVSLARMHHHRVYAKELAAALEKETERPDLIICGLPTVENAGVAADYATRHNVPLLLDIRDHWPDDLVARAPRIVRPLARLCLAPMYRTAHRAAEAATAVTGVTYLQRDYGLKLARRAENPARDRVFYIGYTRTPVSAAARNEANEWWQRQGLRQGTKIACFTGTLGVSFDFSPLITAARALKQQGRRDIQFVLAGDGGNRAKLLMQAGDLAGDMILLPGWIDHAHIDFLMTQSVVALAPYIPNTSMSLPNKFFEYMAYGLPVLSSCTGESEALIRRHGFGVQYDPRSPDEFLAGLLRIIDQPHTARSMSEAALALYENEFDQATLFVKMEQHLRQLARKTA